MYELEKKLIELERNLTHEHQVNEYKRIKHELKEIENEKIKGLIVRSRIKWHEEGEQSTKYFFSLEKSNGIRKHMRKLKKHDGSTTTNQDDITNLQREFYKSLYSSHPPDNSLLNEFKPFTTTKKLDNSDREKCEGLITEEECKIVINSTAKNKSPGNDGLPIEFYVHFWNEIKKILIDSFNYSYEKKELSSSQKQAIITLLNKQGKDRTLLSNWRPISLLNVDYKIVSKDIANCLHNLMPKLVSTSQTGFIKDRQIGDSLRLLIDLIELCKKRKENGILLMIDFEKAFDTLEWNFIFKTLKAMNFGPSLITWIQTFYTNIESCILSNGHASPFFNIGRGVRQGDPLSSYLFVLAVEMLSVAVKENKDIQGIVTKNNHLKVIQYADDTTAILKDYNSVQNFIKVTKIFQQLSGLKINKTKTEAIWLGPLEPQFELPDRMQFSKEPVKVLGIYLCSNFVEMIDINFKFKIKKIKIHLSMWKQRCLSLTGKVLVIKSLAMSQILYLANLLPFPDDKIKEIEGLLYEFVWNCKIPKVKKNIYTGLSKWRARDARSSYNNSNTKNKMGKNVSE